MTATDQNNANALGLVGVVKKRNTDTVCVPRYNHTGHTAWCWMECLAFVNTASPVLHATRDATSRIFARDLVCSMCSARQAPPHHVWHAFNGAQGIDAASRWCPVRFLLKLSPNFLVFHVCWLLSEDERTAHIVSLRLTTRSIIERSYYVR